MATSRAKQFADTLNRSTFLNDLITAPASVDGATQKVFQLQDSDNTIDPNNGTIQTKTITSNTTLQIDLTEGQSTLLMIDGASNYVVNFPTIHWYGPSGNTAPTLTSADALVFWKVNNTLYGASIGNGE